VADRIVVHGYREFLHACDHAGKDSKKQVRDTFRKVGETVRADAERIFAAVDAKSAAGYRVRVRQRGIAVEQSLRKTTGKRPDYGAKQMRDALIPAVDRNEGRIQHDFEAAMDRVADHFDQL
jgi:hypothetical protein